MDYQKNQIYTVKIEDIGADGEGIGKADGFPLFVKDALPGDIAEVRLTKVKKNYAFARLERLIEKSPDRVEPPCPYHRQCGGCQIQALHYEKQLEFKQSKVENNLVRIGGFPRSGIREMMEPVMGMENPWHYRNKAQYPFGVSKEGEIVTGFYAGRTHTIIANTNCLLGVPENQEILEIILAYMKKNKVTAYEEKTGRGLIRHALIRKGFDSGELMVCLVINREYAVAGNKNFLKEKEKKSILPEQEKLTEELAKIPGMTSISVNFNSEKTNVIMGKETCTIWGKDRIQDTLYLLREKEGNFIKTDRGVTYSISPRSFYQVNPVQTEKLYSTALAYAGLTGKETVWDLYCGIGTISLFLAQGAKQVYGVEVIPEAVGDARENARRNGIENAAFFVGKAEEILPGFYEGKFSEKDITSKARDREADTAEPEEAMRHPDVIVVDPPRKGCDEKCLETILKMKPERVVYISCDSATLARDLRVLCDGGYELKKARVCDQFCQGVHVECVIMMRYCGKEKKK